MKSVQEWLKEVDEEKLVRTCFSLPSNPCLEKWETPEIILAFIRRLKGLTPEMPQKQRVFFASISYRDGIELILCDRDDLLTKRCPERGDCIFAEFAQVMGYWVADTELTLKWIYNVLAGVLAQLSFFGYTQEEQAAGWKRMSQFVEQEEAKLEKEGGVEALLQRSISWEEIRERMDRELGRRSDPEARKLEDKIREAVFQYEMHCFEREVAAVRELLQAM